MARITRRRGEVSPGLIALCAIVAILVVLPIVITAFQALQGGTSAVSDAVRASSSRTLLRNTVLVSLVATPIAGVIGVAAAWFVERTRLPGRRLWAVLLVAPLTVPLFVTSYAWAKLGRRAPGLRRRGGDHRVHLLPDRLPAGRRLAPRARSGARGDSALARAQRRVRSSSASSCRSFARPCSAGCCSSRSTRSSSSTRSSRSSSRRSRRTSTPSTGSASAPPARPRCRSSRSSSASCCSSARRGCGATRTTRA